MTLFWVYVTCHMGGSSLIRPNISSRLNPYPQLVCQVHKNNRLDGLSVEARLSYNTLIQSIPGRCTVTSFDREFVVSNPKNASDAMFVFNMIFNSVTSFLLNNLLFTNYVTTTCSSSYSILERLSSGVKVTTSKRQPRNSPLEHVLAK